MNDGPPATGRTKVANTMDWWLRGRIIYTYSLWVVFKAAAVGGIFGEYLSSVSCSFPFPRFRAANTCQRLPPPFVSLVVEDSRHVLTRGARRLLFRRASRLGFQCLGRLGSRDVSHARSFPLVSIAQRPRRGWSRYGETGAAFVSLFRAKSFARQAF